MILVATGLASQEQEAFAKALLKVVYKKAIEMVEGDMQNRPLVPWSDGGNQAEPGVSVASGARREIGILPSFAQAPASNYILSGLVYNAIRPKRREAKFSAVGRHREDGPFSPAEETREALRAHMKALAEERQAEQEQQKKSDM